ncbi:hypothetical protein [Endozoicomonas sp. ONNA2]|uniref:hypothetical protein n=1 Tax=Endozoicomonas sp. ONNA2 TaxID=2828741 RepID=UPI0021487B29|nr:hypothetical protein [Endozoicomonas sp. ONNA2]
MPPNFDKLSPNGVRQRKNREVISRQLLTTIPAGYFRDACETERTHFFHGQPYRSIRRILASIRRQHGFCFTGFGDLTEKQVAEMTGLSTDAAGKAMARKASEPLIWRDGDAHLREFVRLLGAEGLHLTRGGVFIMSPGKAIRDWLCRRC